MGKGIRYTTETFIEKAKEIHGNKYDYSKVDYKGANVPIYIMCPIHGEFNQKPKDHLFGYGCSQCGLDKRTKSITSNTNDFIQKANALYNNKYDYSKVKYTKAIDPVIIICPIHGEFRQIPMTHLLGHGCRKCGRDKGSQKAVLSQDYIIQQFKKVHGDRYNYSNFIYINDRTKGNIICPIHGVFKQSPGDHKRGQGCPKCKESHGEKNIRDYLESKHISYIAQYKFKNCKNKRSLPFDFYLPDYNTCIEFDGVQHFSESAQFMQNHKNFKYVKQNDNIKTNYCKENNIRLIRIPYTDIDKIEDILSIYFDR